MYFRSPHHLDGDGVDGAVLGGGLEGEDGWKGGLEGVG